MTTTGSQYAHTEEAKYIISLNETLLKENTQMRLDQANKEGEMDIIETELGQREKQLTYMRGVLKNFVAMDELRKTIDLDKDMVIHEQDSILTRYDKFTNKFSTFSWGHLYVSAFLFCWCYFGFMYWILPLVSTGTFLLQNWYARDLATLERIKKRIESRKKGKQQDLSKKIEEVKEIEKACDFLNEYIDQM